MLADLERVQRGEVPKARPSFGRAWRHHRRAVARVAALAAMLAVALVLIAWWSDGSDPDAIALRIQRAMLDGDVPGATAPWRDCDDDQRAQVAVALGRRFGADSALAAKTAKELGLALLTVEPDHRRSIALLPAREASPPPVVPAAAFVPADATCSLFVRPGRTWCFVMTTDRQNWWAKDDPWCLQLLLDLAKCDGTAVAHSLKPLPTGGTIDLPPGVRFAAGAHKFRGPSGERECVLDAPCAVAPTELHWQALRMFRRKMGDMEDDAHAALDFWLRHPDEPEAVGKALRIAWKEREDLGTDTMPATTTYWEAYRCAAWHGFRLPSLVEWQIAAHGAKPPPEKADARRVPDRPLAVDSPPEWDKTPDEVCFANTNVREWMLDKRGTDPVKFLAVPPAAGFSGTVCFLPFVPDLQSDAPDEAHGIRLYRSLLPVPGR